MNLARSYFVSYNISDASYNYYYIIQKQFTRQGIKTGITRTALGRAHTGNNSRAMPQPNRWVSLSTRDNIPLPIHRLLCQILLAPCYTVTVGKA